MTAEPVSLADLAGHGQAELAHYLERDRPPGTPLEWLGIAVAHLPELSASARTADDVHPRVRSQTDHLRAPLLDALLAELGTATAILEQARTQLTRRYRDAAGADADPDAFAELLAAGHTTAPRRAETMIAAYAAFLGGAIEVAGALAEAEQVAARARRWEREDHDRLAGRHAAQLLAALANALGDLLAYARLASETARSMRD